MAASHATRQSLTPRHPPKAAQNRRPGHGTWFYMSPRRAASNINDLARILKLSLPRNVDWEGHGKRPNVEGKCRAVVKSQDPGQTVVYEISDTGFTDGIEIRQIVELLEIQNNEGVNDALSQTDATTAALMLRNALMTRLVMLVSRVYASSREAPGFR
jgi:hypothetical protein